MAEDDPFELSRFVAAQDLVFETVLAELRAGRKETRWMWFIFPQLRALGRSPTANFYGIGSIEEARAYLPWTQVQSNLDPKRFTVRTVPALLAKASAWEEYCDGQRPHEQAIKRLGKHKAAA
ncbi:DUF1810 family protein [Sinorhizobium meliloti]|uniref:Calpastatin n=2 Tax=Rhizobium meliloti TaxID=382 RepID=F7XCJ7_SINMM|nr:DUF1810 family protein [Sinorhizobium meliloti]AEH81407.1 hypothetical protein SM11_pC0334 [Sinorhizobium meliloti SM11]AIM01532.1 hypothetical protein DU99_19760 [Sinorhizobium meliloti]ARS67087.1 hypothetical protein SMRU11_07540 [Sinorhizobium meliloti RU11/001]ASP66635.1 DUF1810 domain-containing protein [Sinorhizobium meliloti]ASQ01210.1 DUF1810 domain-containing protein [Sinorhizobium meliloti]